MKKEITIYDIAEKLDISAATVSRALQDNPLVNKKTKKRISDMAAQLGYRSNTFASNLRTKKSNTLGVIVPRLNSLFMSSVIAGIEKVANAKGYNLIISQSLEEQDRERANVETMFNNRVEGLIVSLAANTNDYTHFDTFLKKQVPLIFFDRVSDEVQATKVVIDNVAAGYLATGHLLEQGCQNIIHITGSKLRNVYYDRAEGFKKALAENGIVFSDDMVINNDLSEQSIQECIEELLARKKRPDGLFISNDSSAALALSILKRRGIKVPEDIAIVGFNNDMTSRITEPAITTINYPGAEMGESIAYILINHLNNEGNMRMTSKVELDVALIKRGSSLRK